MNSEAFQEIELKEPKSGESESTGPPLDKYGLVKYSFVLFGIVSILPFTVLGTPKTYWMYKFRDVNSNESFLDDHNKTPLQTYFFSYLNICGFASGLVTMIACILYSHKVSEHKRNLSSLIAVLILFLTTTLMIYVNFDYVQEAFLWFTLAIVVVMNIFCTIFQGTIVAVASKFPPEYVHSVVSAQTLSGILVVLVQISITFIRLPVLLSGFLFFLIADIGIFLALILYNYVHQTNFFKHFNTLDKAEEAKNFSLTNLIECIKLYWAPAATALLTLNQAAAMIPVFMQTESTSNGSSFWKENLFTQVFGLLNAYVSDFSGRKLAGYYPVDRPKLMLLLSILKFGFIPLFLLCNVTPRSNWPVYFTSDYVFFAFVTTFCISGGYLGAIPMFASNKAKESLRETTAFIIITANIVGATSGSVLSWFIFQILTKGM